MYDHSCTRCSLHETAKTVCVEARGDRTLRGMVIGEAPGAKEDIRGAPFLGQAGRLLDDALTIAEIPSVFITNVVKCRPPQNRDPNAAEVDACYTYLAMEMYEVDPVAILVVGNVAARALLRRKDGITMLRGQWYERVLAGSTRSIMPTFHPAYVEYNGGRGSRTWDTFLRDVQKFAGRIREG